MNSLIKMLLIPMILTAFAATSPTANGFSDVESGDEHYVAVSYLEENGIIEGYYDGTFQPYQKVNRAEALKMLTLASGIFSEDDLGNREIDEDAPRPFTDTPLSAWYTKYLVAAKESGIINGYEDDTFRPNQTINLVEALKIFLKSYDESICEEENREYIFFDTPEEAWFTPYTLCAGTRGLLDIAGTNEIFPDQEMTRGYLAEIIYRMIKSQEGYKFGKATFYGKALQGNYTASGEIFDYNLMTAAHRWLPFGTVVEVTNLANNKSIQVKINDRGPYGYGRVIDLSSAAFDEIAWLGTGIINVQFKITHHP